MADLKSFINTSSDRIKSAMGVPVDRIKTIQGSKLNRLGLPTALKDKFLFIWSGNYASGNLKNDLDSSVITITGKDYLSWYIPATSGATFSIPDNATYKTADEDDFWHTGETILQKTLSNLIESDYTRTIIKYDNIAPHNVRAIAILKTGETLTDEEKNQLHYYFSLWLFWSGRLNEYGYLKDNRELVSDPTFVSAQVLSTQPTKVAITFDQELNPLSVPDVSAFDISGKTITAIEIDGTDVILTVSVAYAYGDLGGTVSYMMPETNPLQSVHGYTDAISFEDEPIINNVVIDILDDTDNWGTWLFDDASNVLETALVQQLRDISKNNAESLLHSFDFTSSAGWTLTTGWSIDIVNGKLNGASSGSSASCYYTSSAAILNRVIKFVTIVNSLSGSYLRNTYCYPTPDLAIGTNTRYPIVSTANYFGLRKASTTVTEIESCEIYQILGNHLVNTASAVLPTKSANYIEFDGIDNALKTQANASGQGTIYIVGQRIGTDVDFIVTNSLTGFGELSGNILTIGSNAAASAYYNIRIKAIILSSQNHSDEVKAYYDQQLTDLYL